MLRTRWVLVFAFSFCLTGVSWADYEAAVEAYRVGDYQTALSQWLAVADDGDARAQYAVGAMYRVGLGTTADAEQAARWYRLAAEQGFAAAQFNLGIMYQKGEGVPRDDAIAAEWYLLAAPQDFVQAQFNLAVLYQLGLGVEQDLVEAAAWYLIAAIRGDENALIRLRSIAGGWTDTEVDNAAIRADELMPPR